MGSTWGYEVADGYEWALILLPAHWPLQFESLRREVVPTTGGRCVDAHMRGCSGTHARSPAAGPSPSRVEYSTRILLSKWHAPRSLARLSRIVYLLSSSCSTSKSSRVSMYSTLLVAGQMFRVTCEASAEGDLQSGRVAAGMCGRGREKNSHSTSIWLKVCQFPSLPRTSVRAQRLLSGVCST